MATSAQRPEHGPERSTTKAVSTSSSSHIEYEVEAIIAVAMVRGRPKCLIRRAGYDSKNDTYEPECNLRGCQGLLDAFKARRRVRAQQRGTLLGLAHVPRVHDTPQHIHRARRLRIFMKSEPTSSWVGGIRAEPELRDPKSDPSPSRWGPDPSRARAQAGQIRSESDNTESYPSPGLGVVFTRHARINSD